MGRKKKDKPRIIPEQNQKLCRSICFCQLVFVLSCVAIIYLTVAVYMPTWRAFHSNFDNVPVMCQTIKRTISPNCSWTSCGEWCLTSNSGGCPQIMATVRHNATNVTFKNCTTVTNATCPEVTFEELTHHNCNNGSECATITGLFDCRRGHCYDIGAKFVCNYKPDGIAIDAEINNIKLSGFFNCTNARCVKINKQIVCERICKQPIRTSNVNVFMMQANNILSLNCLSAVAHNEILERNTTAVELSSPVEIWHAEPQSVLLVSCFKATADILIDDRLNATDCLNGTVLMRDTIPKPAVNFTEYWKIYRNSSVLLHPDHKYLPDQSYLTIYNSTKLYINLDACVNTLRGECKEFDNVYGQVGINNTIQSRYTCFYNRQHSNFTITRYDLPRQKKEFLFAAITPSITFVISFVFLIIVTRCVRVGDDTILRCKYCGDSGEQDMAASDSHHKSINSNETEPILSPSELQSPVDTDGQEFPGKQVLIEYETMDSANETEPERLMRSQTVESKMGDDKMLLVLL